MFGMKFVGPEMANTLAIFEHQKINPYKSLMFNE